MFMMTLIFSIGKIITIGEIKISKGYGRKGQDEQNGALMLADVYDDTDIFNR